MEYLIRAGAQSVYLPLFKSLYETMQAERISAVINLLRVEQLFPSSL